MTTQSGTRGQNLTRLLTGTRLDARDSTFFSIVVIFLVIVVGASGAAASFTGQMAIAGWAQLGQLALVVPITIDGAILVYSLAAILLRARGQSTTTAWAVVITFTGISIIINALHVLSERLGDEFNFVVQPIVGAVIASLMPATIFLVVHVLITLLVQEPTDSAEEIRAQIDHEAETMRLAQKLANEEARDNRRADSEAQRRQAIEVEAEAEWVAIRDTHYRDRTPQQQKIYEDVVLEAYLEHGSDQRAAAALGLNDPSKIRTVRDNRGISSRNKNALADTSV